MIRGFWRAVRRFGRTLARSDRQEADLADELRFHLEMQAEANRRHGVPPDRAMDSAERAFGSLARVREESRDARRVAWLENLARDLRIGWRGLRRTPAVSLAAAVTLGLGIGSTTAMFSIANGVLRELPVEEAERLVHVAGVDRRSGDDDLRLGAWELVTLAREQRSFAAVAAFEDETFHLGDATRPAERRSGAVVTVGLFSLLRVGPVLGRGFVPADVGGPPVVLLSDRLWQERFGGDRDMLGRTIRLNGTEHAVIGVMPPSFRFPIREDLWVPFAPAEGALPGEGPVWTAIGRLRDGVSVATARAELGGIGARLARLAPDTYRDRSLTARPYRDEMVNREARVIFFAMVVVVSFVLAIACVNVANLLLARTLGRTRELAVRTALGASRARIRGQLLTEVSLLAAGGGVLGLGLAEVAISAFNAAAGFELSFWMRVAVDRAVLAFTLFLTAAATILAGLAPTRRALRVDLGDTFRSQSRSVTGSALGRTSRALVGVEVALCCALLVATAALVAGVRGQLGSHADLSPAGVLTTQVELRAESYPDREARARYFAALLSSLETAPEQTGIALTTVLPGFSARPARLQIEGQVVPLGERPLTGVVAVTPGYLGVFGAAVLEGRDLDWGDRVDAPPVALVNREFVQRHFAGRSPVGRRLLLDDAAEWVTVVGVVPDFGLRVAGAGGLRGRHRDGVYLALLQASELGAAVVARTRGSGSGLAPALRDAVRRLDPDVPLIGTGSLAAALARSTSSERVFGRLFLAFGLCGLVLAAVGLAGLVAHGVRQRTRELGIRLALGADPRRVRRLVMRGGLVPLGIGLGVGLALAFVVTPVLGEALMGADPRDWRVYLAAALGLGLVGVTAAWLPARRVSRLAPATVLGDE
jgi:putative ABC transport system permease protein